MPFSRNQAKVTEAIIGEAFFSSWPPLLADYEYLRTLSREDFAWEFLRRNRHYNTDYRASDAVIQTIENGIPVTRQHRACQAAEKWGCLTFANPTMPAPSSELFWHPTTGVPTLACIATKSTGLDVTLQGFSQRGVTLSLLAMEDTQYLRVSRSQDALTLAITGVSVRPRMQLSFQILGGATLTRDIEALKLWQSFLTTTSVGRVMQPWTARCLGLRDALIALDGAGANTSYRDIAIVIFGETRVAGEWRANSTLKDRVRRALARGQALRDGGYRMLLNGEWR